MASFTCLCWLTIVCHDVFCVVVIFYIFSRIDDCNKFTIWYKERNLEPWLCHPNNKNADVVDLLSLCMKMKNDKKQGKTCFNLGTWLLKANMLDSIYTCIHGCVHMWAACHLCLSMWLCAFWDMKSMSTDICTDVHWNGKYSVDWQTPDSHLKK